MEASTPMTISPPPESPPGVAAAAGGEHGAAEHDAQQKQYREPHGKNIVVMMLRSYGIVVHDLGVDVSPDEVVARTVELQPDIVGLSGLLTVATEGMKTTVAAVHAAEKRIGRHVPVIIGGGIVDEQTGTWTGADLWTNDASRGVQLIREAIAAARA